MGVAIRAMSRLRNRLRSKKKKEVCRKEIAGEENVEECARGDNGIISPFVLFSILTWSWRSS